MLEGLVGEILAGHVRSRPSTQTTDLTVTSKRRMIHLLNLLAAVALLVWGTHIVRTGVLRLWGETLRQVLAASFKHRLPAALSGLGVASLVQSSTATCLIL